MLKIKTPYTELWDEQRECFIYVNEQIIRLEHSLVSVSKWESKWHKPFLDKNTEKTKEEDRDYIRCMCLDDDIDLTVLTDSDIIEISRYIEDSMTATVINETGSSNTHGKFVTSELIYYWMVAYNIPFECENWHLNRLITLIRICDAENQDPKKKRMSTNEIFRNNKSLNKARQKKFKTKG